MNSYYDPPDSPEQEEKLTAAEAEAGQKAIGCLILGIGGICAIAWGIYQIFFY